jgi:hypothetical protein
MKKPAVSEVTDLVLPILQRMQAQMNAMDRKLDIVMDDVQLLKVRMTGMEEAMAGFNRRMDNMEVNIARIERRLDLTGA